MVQDENCVVGLRWDADRGLVEEDGREGAVAEMCVQLLSSPCFDKFILLFISR